MMTSVVKSVESDYQSIRFHNMQKLLYAVFSKSLLVKTVIIFQHHHRHHADSGDMLAAVTAVY